MSQSQFNRAYKKAIKLLHPFYDVNKAAKLGGAASVLREYFDKHMTYTMRQAHYNDPYGYLVKNAASCAGSTRVTRMCLNNLGINSEHVNENQYGHQWARVRYGGKYWICDSYGLYVGVEKRLGKHPMLR